MKTRLPIRTPGVAADRWLMRGEPLARVHARDEMTAKRAAAALREAYGLSSEAVERDASAVLERFG